MLELSNELEDEVSEKRDMLYREYTIKLEDDIDDLSMVICSLQDNMETIEVYLKETIWFGYGKL